MTHPARRAAVTSGPDVRRRRRPNATPTDRSPCRAHPRPVDERLARLGLELPDPPPAVAAFQPYVRFGTTVYVSGQIATRDGQLIATGRLGDDVDVAAGQEAARSAR